MNCAAVQYVDLRALVLCDVLAVLIGYPKVDDELASCDGHLLLRELHTAQRLLKGVTQHGLLDLFSCDAVIELAVLST